MKASYQISVVNDTAQATPTNFQQLIQTTLQYPSGVRFWSPTDGWLYGWLESLSSTNQANIWVKIPSSIPAGGVYQIYMVEDSSLNFDGVYWGEAPNLSSTYAQYDNGASIFPFYDNFAGTSLNTNNWVNNVSNSGGTLTINNGMSYTPGSSGNSYPFIYSTSTFSAGVYEIYGDIPPGANTGSWIYSGFGLGSSGGAYTNAALVGVFNANYGLLTSTSSATNTVGGLSAGTYIWQVWIPSSSPSTIYGSQNYGAQISSSTDMPTLPQPIVFGEQYNTGINLGPFYWTRVRDYPPNGVMPATAIVPVQAWEVFMPPLP